MLRSTLYSAPDLRPPGSGGRLRTAGGIDHVDAALAGRRSKYRPST